MGDIFLFVILFVYGFAVILMGCVALKNKKPKNKVHFYVARDKYGCLGLFIGKPIIDRNMVILNDKCTLLGGKTVISDFGLDENDYDNLKFGDEPVEVFLNLED